MYNECALKIFHHGNFIPLTQKSYKWALSFNAVGEAFKPIWETNMCVIYNTDVIKKL
jgi:hypothetical protein